jgi:hypothetical protein
MPYQGQIFKFPVNRPLDDFERKYQLKQKVRLDIEPHDSSSVIKLNSTYLETVDKWFSWKGASSALLLGGLGGFGALYASFLYITLTRAPGTVNDDTFVLTAFACMLIPFFAVLIWLLRKESFAYTHYPLRFNRKSRMVHVFRTNGTVLSVRWDEVFFTLGKLNRKMEWEVRGHVLGQDGVSVIETFAFSHASPVDMRIARGQVAFDDSVRAHWEFIRRYMEQGPGAVTCAVHSCAPIDKGRENARESMQRILANDAESPRFVAWLFFLPSVLGGIARVFAMYTSKIPQWPKEIEAANPIEPNDPYAIEGGPDHQPVPLFPEAARAAGVEYGAQRK